MQKAITGFIRKEHDIKNEITKISIDEMVETDIFDSQTMEERQNFAKKKIRKVFAGQPITVQFRMTNDLLEEVHVTNLTLVCEGVRYTPQI